MIDPKRGNKHKCRNGDCLKPFYDLGQTRITCPNCGTPFDADIDANNVAAETAKVFRSGHRRNPPVFKIVSPEVAVQLLIDEPQLDKDRYQGPGDGLKVLLDAEYE